jgi:hypothetical protein
MVVTNQSHVSAVHRRGEKSPILILYEDDYALSIDLQKFVPKMLYTVMSVVEHEKELSKI